MINFYYFDGQLRNYLIQFCNIFVGLKVKTGKGTCNVDEYMSVPIAIGTRDRVVAAIQASNTQNKPFSLPTMAASMVGLSRSQTRKGISVIDRRTFLEEGGVFPDDLKTLVRVMPIPFIMSLELSIYASNTLQLQQILEQILILFDYTLQLQIGDAATDWTKITSVELTGINNEENFPPGGDRRIIIWSLQFDMPIYISAPMDVRNEVVRQINIRLGDLSGFNINEYDEDGNLSPFSPEADYGTIVVTGNT